MRWLVTGAGGMLGTDLVAVLQSAGHDVTALGRGDLDITDPVAAEQAAAGHDVVVNCAAWTAVDDAESAEPDAFRVNGVGAASMARAAHRAGARIVQVSTDYVFDGAATAPYPEGAPLAPRSAYGRTKAAGEWAVAAEAPDHLIVRTAWLYGAHGPCFPKTIARLLSARDHIDVVADQSGQPTWTHDLADLIVRLVAASVPAGIYHGTAGGLATWREFAQDVAVAVERDPEDVRATTSESFVRPAPRPAYSALAHDALVAAGVDPIGPWRERWTAAAGAVLA